MKIKDFRELEAKLGHPPTREEIRAAQAKKSMFKTANVQFNDPKYNYKTSVNGRQTDEQIINYFKGQIFNLGNVRDDLHRCIECTVEASDLPIYLN